MRTFMLGGAVAVALIAVGSAQAADLPARPAPVYKAPAMVPVFSWTGFYIGINGGGAWGTSHHNFDAVGTTTGNYNVDGGMVGGTVGYNWEIAPWVLGFEGDIDWADVRGSAFCPNPAFTCETKDSWFATARGRVGYAINNWMPYVTGGGAFGDIKANIPTFGSASATRSGWTVGAGIEANIAGGWSAKVEYLYADLGSMNCGFSCTITGVDNVNLKLNIVRAGLNYRFGGPY